MSNERSTTTLEVQGMTCPSCIDHVGATLADLAGVGAVDVQLSDGLIVIQHDAAQASVARLIELLSDAGYEATQRQV